MNEKYESYLCATEESQGRPKNNSSIIIEKKAKIISKALQKAFNMYSLILYIN